MDFALSYQYPPYGVEEGIKKVVAFGEHSHKCPTYLTRIPPCTSGCPAGEDIRGYHNILRGVEKFENSWEAAWRRIVDKNPFPAVMGRVCPHPCETLCNRSQLDESVGINSVEHAIGDFGIKNNLQFEKPPESTGHRVAVIGGGPAGLSASYQLARKGHQVTIFDAREKLGGMMRYGIMGYRVDREILDAEIERIINLGIKTRMNTRIGLDISLDDLKEQFDAVFVGVGAQKGVGLPVKGYDDSPAATNAIDFLIDFEENGQEMRIGNNILVVGDGNVAMDVARLAMRLGVGATVVSAVPRDEMACFAEEYDDAINEGVRIEVLVGISEIVTGNGEVKAVKCVRMGKKDQGEEGYDSPVPFFRYKPTGGTEFRIDCDMVVSSIGQATDMKGLESLTEKSPWLKVDRNYRVEGEEKIFGGGDAIKIDLITTAVGHGRKAAESIVIFLSGKQSKPGKFEEIIKYEKLFPYYFPQSQQGKREKVNIEEVKGTFQETLNALAPDSAVVESERCMSCGLCFECRQCMLYCPQDAISHFKNNGVGEVMFTDYSKCVGCHICSQVCPAGYIHMGMGEDL